MPLPRKTSNSTRMAARGCLTRLALYFDARHDDKFSGEEVTKILIAAVHAIESPEIVAEPKFIPSEALRREMGI